MQSPKPEVIKPFNESSETLKANQSMKKEGSYDPNSRNRTWKRTHWSAWPQSWDYNQLTEKQRDTIRKWLMNTTENTRERPDVTTEYWRLGGCLDGGEESIIITSEQIRHENPFLSPEHLGSEETLTQYRPQRNTRTG